MQDEESGFWEKWGIKLILGLMVLMGTLIATLFESGATFWERFFQHFGMALALSGIIGLTIDLALQRQIIRNVFRAAIGYLLPTELRSELRWIYNLPLLCERHVQDVHISRIAGTDLVTVRVNILRTFKNISDKEQSVPVGLGINEWFYDGHPSRILSLTYQEENKPASRNCAPDSVEKIEAGLKVKTIDVELQSRKKLTICFEYEETMPVNCWTFATFSTATANPIVNIDSEEGIEAKAIFSYRDKGSELIRKGPHTWQLDGMLLPHQVIRIHWFDKERNAAWQVS